MPIVCRRSGVTLKPDAIKQQLAAVVPEYMVPSRIVMLERLPLTPNGKVDRKALPEPAEDAVVASYSAPVGETEEAIAAVWREVLGRERIGRNDNFFELGGDSILSLQIIARLRKRGIRLTPKQVFGQQTVAAAGNRCRRRGGACRKEREAGREVVGRAAIR